MNLHYFKLAIRLLIRNPFFTIINVVGLAVGFTVFFILWQHAQSELSADRHYRDGDRIARVSIDWKWTDDGESWGHLLIAPNSSGTIHKVTQDFATIESSLRILHQEQFSEALTGHGPKVMLSYEKKDGTSIRFKETRGLYADPNLFEFFSIPLLIGDRSKILKENNSIVLSQSTALRYFGGRSPLDEILVLNGTESLKVTGVFEDLQANTHLLFDFVISNRSRENEWNKALWSGTHCYVKLTNNQFKDVENNINAMLPVYWEEVFKTLPHVKARLILQPLHEVAFSEEFLRNNFQPKSRIILIAFSGVAIAILLMAWVNYINLTVYRINKRLKEVATRKMTGAKTSDFIKQFLIESTMVNLLAVALAITLVQFIRQPAYVLFQIAIPKATSLTLLALSFFAAVFATGILLTGLYPAIMSASFSPRSLFSSGARASANKMFASVLTTAQYAVAIILIFSGLVIHQQLNHIVTRDIGFEKDHVLIIDAPVIRQPNYLNDLKVFNDKLATGSDIVNSSSSTAWINLSVKSKGRGMYINIDGYGVDENYIPLYRMRFLAGRNFRRDEKANSIIVTRFAAERMKFKNPEDAIGRTVVAGPVDTQWTEMEIIGVIENIKTTPFYRSPNNSEAETGRGVAFIYGNKAFEAFLPETLSVKLHGSDLQSSLKKIEQTFTEVFEGNIFSASFLDSQINNIYHTEKLTRNQISFFTCLAVGIACLGLLGMITNKAVEKKKEIGIRKTLGAGVKSLASVLLNVTMRQIVTAIAVGLPIAYYVSQQYLERFTDRITIHWWYFVLPATLLLLIMSITIFHVLAQAVNSNPVDSIRHND